MNKVVLVTGSSRGIGAATILKFASLGYDVVINYLNHTEEANSLKKEVEEKYGVRAICIKCDVSNELEVKDMINLIISEFGTIDVLVNNAGISLDNDVHDKTVEEFVKVVSVNLIGSFLTYKYVKPIMKSNKNGKIINVTSTNGIDTYYKESMDYDASKAGLISLTKNMALDMAPCVNVNAVACGWVNTDVNKELNPEFKNNELSKILLNRFAESNEIANVIAFLASDEASYINGSIIRVDGGYRR